MLDQNAEAAGHEFFDLGAFEISPDHRLVAWSADTSGDEHYTLRIRDIAHQRDLDDELHDTTWAGVAWSSDGTHLFYVEADEQERPYRVMRHRLGTPQSDDVEVFVDHDERFFVGIGATRSREWIVIHSGSKQSLGVLAAARRRSRRRRPMLRARPRRTTSSTRSTTGATDSSILTNHDAVDFRVMQAPLDDPGDWTELIAHQPGRRITGVEPFEDHLALHEWNRAQPAIRIVDRDGVERCSRSTPNRTTSSSVPTSSGTPSVVRLTHQSLTAAGAGDRRRRRDRRRSTVVKQTPTPNVDLDHYVAARQWATADDGTEVPVDVVRHVDTPLDGTAPCCVYGYGSYEISMPPWFSVARLSLLDRGVVWALAHPRGGGELGRAVVPRRQAAEQAQHVHRHARGRANTSSPTGVADRDAVAIRGGSAGGLLVGACVTMEPERFRVSGRRGAVRRRHHHDERPDAAADRHRVGGVGRPARRAVRRRTSRATRRTTTPYPADYPALMITAGLNDPRVSFHEPAKWIAKLRDVRTNDAPLILQDRDGRRPRRAERPLRRVARRGTGARVPARHDLTFDDGSATTREHAQPPLRTRCPTPIGLADQAPKHAHGGRSCDNRTRSAP